MSSGEVNGKTVEEVRDFIHDRYEGTVYEERGIPPKTVFCLAEIRFQPEDYDGPQRYCVSYATQRADDPKEKEDFAPKCRHHGGASVTGDDVEYPDSLAEVSLTNLKHGMYASDEHLKQDFTEEDQKLYDFIMSWAETYGIEKEEDPAQYDLLQQLAVERVRAARSSKYLLEEGETDDTPVFDSQGNPYEREDVSNALSETHQRQRKLIVRIMKEMGLTPKERSRMDADSREASATEEIAEVAKSALNSEEGSYDPTT